MSLKMQKSAALLRQSKPREVRIEISSSIPDSIRVGGGGSLTMNGIELRNIRERLDLSQTEMAEVLGVHWNTVARYERDELPIPRSIQLLALLRLSGLTEPKKKKKS